MGSQQSSQDGGVVVSQQLLKDLYDYKSGRSLSHQPISDYERGRIDAERKFQRILANQEKELAEHDRDRLSQMLQKRENESSGRFERDVTQMNNTMSRLEATVRRGSPDSNAHPCASQLDAATACLTRANATQSDPLECRRAVTAINRCIHTARASGSMPRPSS